MSPIADSQISRKYPSVSKSGTLRPQNAHVAEPQESASLFLITLFPLVIPRVCNTTDPFEGGRRWKGRKSRIFRGNGNYRYDYPPSVQWAEALCFSRSCEELGEFIASLSTLLLRKLANWVWRIMPFCIWVMLSLSLCWGDYHVKVDCVKISEEGDYLFTCVFYDITDWRQSNQKNWFIKL